MWKHESPGHRNTKTAVPSLVGFSVGLHEVCVGVGCGLREEDSSIDRGCGKALKKLLVETLLDGGDKLLQCPLELVRSLTQQSQLEENALVVVVVVVTVHSFVVDC